MGSDEGCGGAVADGEATGASHVHGLGAPADGALYVATHDGTFRISEEGIAERIGDSLQDAMGFTVVGPNHFLGSGHPDVPGLQAGQPGLLGLIESTDGGATWEKLSLAGEVDFHGLAMAHDQIYGWDSTSGRFMVSRDGRSWESRSTVQLFGFAVDPDDADHVVAAGPEGLVVSREGGRTWQRQEGPDAVTVSWQGRDLRAATGDGAVQRSHDGGETWAVAGELPGEPHVLLAEGGRRLRCSRGGFGHRHLSLR